MVELKVFIEIVSFLTGIQVDRLAMVARQWRRTIVGHRTKLPLRRLSMLSFVAPYDMHTTRCIFCSADELRVYK